MIDMNKRILTTSLLFLLFSHTHALDFISPLDSFIPTSSIGPRESPWGGGTQDFHPGADLWPTGSDNVYAMADGIVITHYPPPGIINGKLYKGHPDFGALIIIKHADGFYSIYGHMRKTFVSEKPGYNFVTKGQVIALVGSTGKSTGKHLHSGLYLDPLVAIAEAYYERVRLARLRMTIVK
jgi:murein DD-endopeptidase MepM/ murein hydrolase activator NlpD